jgi:DNA polymerase-3 subunit beta
MKLDVDRQDLADALQAIVSVVERRHNLPILSNVLMETVDQELCLIGTDQELELREQIPCTVKSTGAITASARKLMDITRSLSSTDPVRLELKDSRLVLSGGKSRFSLVTLPAADFPETEAFEEKLSLPVPMSTLKQLIDATQFAMAQQDVRYWLNGMLFEFQAEGITAVATDGHRLATSQANLSIDINDPLPIIVPRKAIQEIGRRLSDQDNELRLVIGSNHLQVDMGEGKRLTTRLLEGRFPDYRRVIPTDGDKHCLADREGLREALSRVAVLVHDKLRGVSLSFTQGSLKLQAHNADQEEAEEEFPVDYTADDLEIGFNVNYLLDVLGAITTEKVEMVLSESAKSCVIKPVGGDASLYVVSPMRL